MRPRNREEILSRSPIATAGTNLGGTLEVAPRARPAQVLLGRKFMPHSSHAPSRCTDRSTAHALFRPGAEESVRRLHEELQSFLSISRIEARCRNASALWLRFSQSLASRRQRLSQPMVRSTIQRLGGGS